MDNEQLDPDQIAERKRMRELFETLNYCRETVRKADEQHYLGDLGQFRHRTFVRRSVSEVCRMVKWPMLHYLDEKDEIDGNPMNMKTATDYWAGVSLGEFATPDGTVEIVGLQGFLNAPDTIEITHEETTQSERQPIQRETRTEKMQIPVRISMSALDACEGWLHEVGIGIDVVSDAEIADGRNVDIPEIGKADD